MSNSSPTSEEKNKAKSQALEKNADAVAQALADMDTRIREQDKVIVLLQQEVGSLKTAVTELQQQVAVSRAKSMGSGATSR